MRSGSSFCADDEEEGIFFQTETTNISQLDEDIGDFCFMLMSKLRLQSGALGAQASRTVRHALQLSISALAQAGLPVSSEKMSRYLIKMRLVFIENSGPLTLLFFLLCQSWKHYNNLDASLWTLHRV